MLLDLSITGKTHFDIKYARDAVRDKLLNVKKIKIVYVVDSTDGGDAGDGDVDGHQGRAKSWN